MKALQLLAPAPVSESPLTPVEVDDPSPGVHQILVRVLSCGVCHTDLHIVEGDLPLPKIPIIPGHQIVGVVDRIGSEVNNHRVGDRVGVPWFALSCGTCSFCLSGRENLCDRASFTGYHIDGGYAEFAVAHMDSAYPIDHRYSDTVAAPLLCAGVIGYRALRLSGMRPGGRAGLYGFGASAHIAIQILRHWNCEVYVFTRAHHHQELATEFGASWVGSADEQPPHLLDSAIIFAPAGNLVVSALKMLEKGGTVTLAGIHMSTIPSIDYALLYQERAIRSVANSTRQDVRELLALAKEVPFRIDVETYPLNDANRVLQKLKRSEIRASAVLKIA